MYFIYFARSLKNGKIYVGFTSKTPETRIKEHNRGDNQWSRVNRPLKLVYYESFICKQDVMLREKFFKTGFGKRIKKVIVHEMDG